jgi:hypothetical protein
MRRSFTATALLLTAWLLVTATTASAMRITFKGKGSFSYHLEANYDDDETTDISSSFSWNTVYAQAPVPGSKSAPANFERLTV